MFTWTDTLDNGIGVTAYLSLVTRTLQVLVQ